MARSRVEQMMDRLRDSLSAFEQARTHLLKKHNLKREELGLAVDIDPVSLL